MTKCCSKNRSDFNRRFNTSHYETTEWLTGSVLLNKLFCWPCLLFYKHSERNVWNSEGFSDLNHLSSAISKLEKNRAPIANTLALKNFGTIRIDLLLDEQRHISIKLHNDLVRRNRNILKVLINVVCLLGKQEFSFKGHDESELSLNRGNYKEFLHFISEFHEPLAQHLRKSTVFQGTSAAIQNDIIYCIGKVMLKAIETEMSHCKFVSILLDETTDISPQSQLSVVFCYVVNGMSSIGFMNLQISAKIDRLLLYLHKLLI